VQLQHYRRRGIPNMPLLMADGIIVAAELRDIMPNGPPTTSCTGCREQP
jgi:hypothetical protein